MVNTQRDDLKKNHLVGMWEAIEDSLASRPIQIPSYARSLEEFTDIQKELLCWMDSECDPAEEDGACVFFMENDPYGENWEVVLFRPRQGKWNRKYRTDKS